LKVHRQQTYLQSSDEALDAPVITGGTDEAGELVMPEEHDFLTKLSQYTLARGLGRQSAACDALCEATGVVAHAMGGSVPGLQTECLGSEGRRGNAVQFLRLHCDHLWA
jgi:hypothetical protein